MGFLGILTLLALLGLLAYALLLRQFAPDAAATVLRWPTLAWPAWRWPVATDTAGQYAQPWLLLLGEPGAGKSSLSATVRAERLRKLGERGLLPSPGAVPGATALALDDGVLWDPDGTAWNSDAKAQLDALARLRPLRPLDGLVWVVNAATLRDASPEAARLMGQQAAAQFDTVRRRLGLLLPVYVVISQCDAIEGFQTFWRASASKEQRQQMLGWSCPGDIDAEALADMALDTLHGDLTRLQLAAARGEDIAQGLSFALFPQRLDALRAPLQQLLGQAFHGEPWQRTFACRGVYVAGALDDAAGEPPRADLSFVADLVSNKVLAERGLARLDPPTRWARLRAWRAWQAAGLALGATLLAGVSITAHRIEERTEALARASQALPAPGLQSCAGSAAVAAALTQAAAWDGGLRSAWMPWSLLAPAPDGLVVDAVRDKLLGPVVLPALACKLNEAVARVPSAPPAPDDAARRRAVLEQATRAQRMDEQLSDYQLLFEASSATARQAAMERLAQGLLGLAPVRPDATHLPGRALAGGTPDARVPSSLPPTWLEQLAQLPRAQQALIERDLRAGPARVAAAQTLADRQTPAAAGVPGLREQAQALSDWLSWLDTAWLPLNASRNPCTEAADALAQRFAALRLTAAERTRLGASLEALGPSACFTPLSRVLRELKLGRLQVPLVGEDQTMNPVWRRELTGLQALLSQGFAKVDGDQTLACLANADGWQASAIDTAWGYARAYQRLAQAQGTAGPGTAAPPLFDQLARVQLERAMNGAMRAAQLPPPAARPGLPAPVDDGMPKRSADLTVALQSLLPVQQLYGQLNMTASAANLASCTRSQAHQALLQLKSLAATSQLYLPGPGHGGQLLDLGPPAVARDFLAQQLTRSATLVDYARPYVRLLGNSTAVNDGQLTSAQTGPYWANTATELQRYTQGKDTAGQVGQLENLVMTQLVTLSADNCAAKLGAPAAAAASAPTPGQDLFSDRRAALETRARLSCTATAYASYQALARRFNDQLAGRYPFGELNTPDAALADVKRFFLDYAEQATPLAASLAASTDARAKTALAFLKQLDATAAFLRASLTAGELSQPLTLSPSFRLKPESSPGSENVISWAFSSGPRVLVFPGGPATTLSWPFGQALSLDLSWPDGSVGGGAAAVWQPSAAPGFTRRGATASFGFGGDWALLRLIEGHRPTTLAIVDPLDPTQLQLEFKVPTQRLPTPAGPPASAEARLYLGLRLSGIDPKTQAAAPVTWPGPFPRSAPL